VWEVRKIRAIFETCYWRFLRSNTLEQLEWQLEQIIAMLKPKGTSQTNCSMIGSRTAHCNLTEKKHPWNATTTFFASYHELQF
jgi:hypothetical protein